MLRSTLIFIAGLAVLEAKDAAAQPAEEPQVYPNPDTPPALVDPSTTSTPPAQGEPQPLPPQPVPSPSQPPQVAPPSPAPPSPLMAPVPQTPASAPNPALSEGQYPAPVFILQPPLPAKRVERDKRALTFGVGPLVLANAHWLDQPSDKSVTVGTRQGIDEQYPGFLGFDATLGLMLDIRYLHFLGVEVDVFLQNDRGTGTIAVRDAGSMCFIPGTRITIPTHSYEVTIGQMAWHVPLLFKLSLPGHWNRVRRDDDNVVYEIRRVFHTLAFGPEFVFPRSATISVSPTGLEHPARATASNYIMLTGALGLEYRVSDSHDIRLLLSARGSYNPTAGSSAMKRAEYDMASNQIVAVAYRSEWRYQAALTLGAGWFF